MNEYDSPSYTEYSYEKHPEGKMKLLKLLLILSYIAFVGVFFLFCYLTRIVPLFAVCPIFLWMLVYFTWGLVSFDVYYTFNHGEMVFGKYKTKKGVQKRRPCLSLKAQDAYLAAPFDESFDRAELDGVKRIFDYSSSSRSSKLIIIIFDCKEKRSAVIFDGTKRVSTLLSSFSKNARDLKTMEF